MPRSNYQHQVVNPTSSPHRRIKILKYVVLGSFAVIAIRLFFIQIVEHDYWTARADEEHTMLETIAAKRGDIYMMDHDEPVAIVLNQTTYQVVIDPTVTDKEEIKKALETYAKDYIAVDFDEIYKQEGLRYSIVAKNVPREIIEKLAEQNLAAVYFKKTNQRVYPEGELASSVLGFVNADGVGQYGIESSLGEIISGKDGLLKSTADVNKIALSIGNDNIKIPAKDGKNVVLSIDRGLERKVEQIVQSHIDNTAADHASALIMNPNTGEILVMANLPNYDPANYGNVTDASVYMNQITEVPYEPASVCKSFAFSAAINEGVMTADTTYFNQGYEIVDGWKIQNAEQRASLYGTLDMKTALYWSLNTGSIHALKLLGGNPNQITQQGREKLYNYYHDKFRLDYPTGVELAETEGVIPDPNEGLGRDSTYANMTFGQNLNITMLQTATAYSAVVNGGTWRTPTILKGFYEDGEITPRQEKEEGLPVRIEDKILSDETSATMRDMFINNRSYKKRGGIDRQGYDIGGKSGTAQVIKNGAYDDSMSETVGTYIGFVAPTGEMPQYVIMVKMLGDGRYLDGGIASNLFDDIENFLIDYLKIKPGVI
ncbi:penicillin-binding protein 2 [Candidatus Saccharibacteria bacterium]|nr:penicillin-binding protein 2 [Candidatus Saccharibacteria bacterium]